MIDAAAISPDMWEPPATYAAAHSDGETVRFRISELECVRAHADGLEIRLNSGERIDLMVPQAEQFMRFPRCNNR
jgi:hypothetical protein